MNDFIIIPLDVKSRRGLVHKGLINLKVISFKRVNLKYEKIRRLKIFKYFCRFYKIWSLIIVIYIQKLGEKCIIKIFKFWNLKKKTAQRHLGFVAKWQKIPFPSIFNLKRRENMSIFEKSVANSWQIHGRLVADSKFLKFKSTLINIMINNRSLYMYKKYSSTYAIFYFLKIFKN